MSQEASRTAKRCCRCHDEKSLDEFYNAKSSGDGKQRICRSCKRADSNLAWQKLKAHDEKHRELLERRRGYREKQNVGKPKRVAKNPVKCSRDDAGLETKECGKCHEMKLLSQFYRNRKKPDGRRRECKDCSNAYGHARYLEHHDEILERRKGRIVNNWQRPISREEYQEIATTQKNVCAICGQSEVAISRRGKLKNLAIDHCHKTGRIRGLLCFNCNVGLGKFKDDPELLERALAYLVGSSLNVAG